MVKGDDDTIRRIRINPVYMRVHPEFKDLMDEIRNERIIEKVDTVSSLATHPELTKAVTNMIRANDDTQKKALVQVKIMRGNRR